MRGATAIPRHFLHVRPISIHTPHAGSDRSVCSMPNECSNFNPHSPCGERPCPNFVESTNNEISIHTPHAGSDVVHAFVDGRGVVISIHTPHAGSDSYGRISISSLLRFQSTLPMRGATNPVNLPRAGRTISIHTPHAGSDDQQGYNTGQLPDFNPHSPCGERRSISAFTYRDRISIHTPHAGSDVRGCQSVPGCQISIHTPHAGSDIVHLIPVFSSLRFQSTLPMRGATRGDQRTGDCLRFQSTLPMRGATPHRR